MSTEITALNELLGIGNAEPQPSVETELTGQPFRDEEMTEEAVEALRAKIAEDDLDYMDETVAKLLEEHKAKEFGLKEGQKTPGQLFKSMTPAQRAALFATYHVKSLKGVGPDHPMWIDKEAVPASIHLHWFNPEIVTSLGMRGYRPVKNTPGTRKWAPNARQLGTNTFLKHANMTLCWRDADAWLDDQVQNHRQTNAVIEDEDDRFRSALRSVPGIDSRTAAQLAGQGRGILAYRGADPELAYQHQRGQEVRPDYVLGEGEK